jgi:hypothetical protein
MNHSIEPIVVGDGQGVYAQGLSSVEEVFGVGSPIQQGVVGVTVELDVAVHRLS